MNIIYIASGTNLSGGATKSLLTLLKGVTAQGHRALVVCPDKNGLYGLVNSGFCSGASAVSLNFTYDIYPFLNNVQDYILFIPRLIKRVLKNRIAACRLKKISLDFGADIIHSNTSVNNIGYLAAKSLSLPHVWHIREYGKNDFSMIVPFQRKKLSSPDNYTICITKDIQKSKGLEHDPDSVVIYNGIIDAGRLCYEEDDSYFLYAGRVTERKGALDLVEAYCEAVRKYGKKMPELKIVGRADEDIDLRIRETGKLCLGNGQISMCGEYEDITDLLRHAKAVIVPSFSEGFGRILPEAMACGALTVGRNVAGTKEQFDNGIEHTGGEIGLKFKTAEELTSILIQLADSKKSDYEDMINRSQTTVIDLYGVRSYIDKVLDLYDGIVKKKK